MANAHDLPEAIQWHEGMLLSPQHFQQASARQEALLAYHAHMIQPYHWGIRHLRLDPVLLVDGQFRVVELEAIMPDGLLVSSLRHDISSQTLDLGPMKDEAAERPLTIHLAVPAERFASTPAAGSLSRYDSAEGAPVADANTGEGEIRIPRLRPRLSLVVGETAPDKYSSFPLAQVAYRDEAFSLTDYVPPQLRVARNSKIGELCSRIALRLREKAVLLAEKARSPSVAARAPQLLETRNRVAALAGALPQFEALVQCGQAHPFPVYLSLCNVVGTGAALGNALLPPVLETYDHNNLYATFHQATRFLNRMVAEGFIESYSAYPFGAEKGRFSIKFDPQWASHRLILGVRAKSGMPDQEATSWIQSSLIGSASRMESMRQRRVLGPERKVFEGEDDLVPTPGVTLFSVAPDPDFIAPDEDLLIYNPDDPAGSNRPAEIVLYIRKKPVADVAK